MRVKRLLFNLVAMTPGISQLEVVKQRLQKRALGTGGSNSARYCYSVWLRHLVKSSEALGIKSCPPVVAEFGPGDSIGLGLAALLSGAREYRAFDVVPHASLSGNERVFDELVDLFSSRAPIPDQNEFPAVGPRLSSYEFPSHILTDSLLSETLGHGRIERIRASLHNPSSADSCISYVAPWRGSVELAEGSVDWIISQAVLEHVDELAEAYSVMAKWLKVGGWMSHQIDFTSHGWMDQWNGHWACSDLYWKVFRGPDVWLINREPFSTHRGLLQGLGFSERLVEVERRNDGIRRSQLARRFAGISDEDLEASSAFVVLAR